LKSPQPDSKSIVHHVTIGTQAALKEEVPRNLRLLVVRENWPGNNGLSLLSAFVRAGVDAQSIAEPDYVPLMWKHLAGRLLRRAVRPVAVREFNDALIEACENPRPNLFVAVKGTFIQAETLSQMRQKGIVLYLLYPDVSMFAHGPYLPRAIPKYDWVFTTKSFGPKDLQERLNVRNCSFMPPAFDPEVHHPRRVTSALLDTFGCDVAFIGAWSPKKQKILEALVQRRPQLKLRVWGNSWSRLTKESCLRPFVAFRQVLGIDYASAVSCARINLGLLSELVPGASSGDLITTRTFEIPACGGLLLHERTTDLLQIFKEDESCVCFEGIDELVRKIDDLLSNEQRRQAIAARGREVVASAHSWDHRARAMLDHYWQNQPRQT